MGIFDQEEGEDKKVLKELEQQEIDLLLEKGLEFKTGGKTYLIRPLTGGTLLALADQFIKLDINEAEIESGEFDRVWAEQKRAARKNWKICAKIVAIAVLQSRWKIKLLGWWYARKFLWTLTSNDLLRLTGIIMKMGRLQDFCVSIVLLRENRITAPTTIE